MELAAAELCIRHRTQTPDPTGRLYPGQSTQPRATPDNQKTRHYFRTSPVIKEQTRKTEGLSPASILLPLSTLILLLLEDPTGMNCPNPASCFRLLRNRRSGMRPKEPRGA